MGKWTYYLKQRSDNQISKFGILDVERTGKNEIINPFTTSKIDCYINPKYIIKVESFKE